MTTILHIPLDESGTGWEISAAGLPAEEQERTKRFHFEADRLRFAKCRAVLRGHLGALLGIAPREVQLRFGDHGKPFPDYETDIQFNISHTRGAALIAFGRGAEIGVDVENAKRMSNLEGVARKVFTQREQAALFALADDARRTLFFRLWTAKEAFLKAVGSGLSLDPAAVEAHLPDEAGDLGQFECGRVEHVSALRCVEVPQGDGLHAMLCATEAGCAFELR